MKKKFLSPRFVFFLLLTASLFFPKEMQAQFKFKGGPTTIEVGGEQPDTITFINKSKKDFYDFRINIVSDSAIPYAIDTMYMVGKTYHETKKSGTTGKIETDTLSNGKPHPYHRIPKGDTAQLIIKFTQTPENLYEIIIQPTGYNHAAVLLLSSGAHFGPCGTYMTTFSAEMVAANFLEGLSFGEVNTTALPISQLSLTPKGAFSITNAFLLNPLGVPIPGGFYDPASGLFTLPQPVMPGDTFGVHLLTDSLLSAVPMEVEVCSGFPPFSPPFFDIVTTHQLNMEPDSGKGYSPAGELTFRYLTPLTHSIKYLNILYKPLAFGDTNTYWIGQNIALEHFSDTMELSLGFDMLPGADTLPLFSSPSVHYVYYLSDTIFTDQAHFNFSPFTPYPFQHRGIYYGPIIPPQLLTGPSSPSPLTSPQWQAQGSLGALIGCNMPNIDLNASVYDGIAGGEHVPADYEGDQNACAPAATANSFQWLRTIHPDIDQKLGEAFGQGDSAHRKILAAFSELMDHQFQDGVTPENLIKGKLAFIDAYKLPMRVTYQSLFLNDASIASPHACYGHSAENKNNPNTSTGGNVSAQWIYDRVAENCDTELGVVFVKENASGDLIETRAHAIVLTGVRNNNGNWRIRWKDDRDQQHAGGLRQGLSDVIKTPDGKLWIDKLSHPDLGKPYVRSVFAECYDPTVTFNAVKGKAFEDRDEDGIQDADEEGVADVSVRLIDASNGVTLAEQLTAYDGTYLFHDLPAGAYYAEFTALPPGYDFSLQDIGSNDSIDSDVNTWGSTPIFTLLDHAQTHLDAGLIPAAVVRIIPLAWLQAEIDPATTLMFTASFEQNAMPQLGDHYSAGHTFLPYSKDSIYLDRLTENPVDWMVVELRDGSDSSLSVAASPALMMPHGEIRGADNKPLRFHGIEPGNYYVVLHHRNSLSVMSLMPIYLDATPTAIDFTSLSLPVYGTDSRTFTGGRMVMTGGDANADGVINAADRSASWNKRNSSGYLDEDINLDNVVNAADRSATWNNRNKQQELP